MDYFFEEDDKPEAPIDPRGTFVLALSTTILGVVFLLLLIGDQVAAAALFPF